MYSVSRLTLYALLSAVEEDLRRIITQNLGHLHPDVFLIGDLRTKLAERVVKELGAPYSDLSIKEICFYLDFGDLYQALNTHRKELPQSISRLIKENTSDFENLVPIRNRVAHSRPLSIEDWPTVFDTTELLLSRDKELWASLSDIFSKIKRDPSFVLDITIPPAKTGEIIQHNLPIPDFDETGYFGRKDQIDRLIKLCSGPYPVITIVGEGGIGKTALALKVAYELMDLENRPFDAIVWASSKTTQLTPQEIIHIEGAIRDSLGMFQYVAQELSGRAKDNPLEEVLDYLREFRILLIIDNLETIIDERIKSFLEQLPQGSKVLITSRIGLGAFEFPLKLEKMDGDDAARLLRALARVRGIESLYKLEAKILRNYCDKMNNSPGYIKWFVSTIQTGKRAEEVFEHSDLFLDFCMSNVYRYLSDTAKSLLRTMFVIYGKHTQAELVYITGQEISELQRAVHETLRTNMIIISSESFGTSLETSYELSDLARQYIAKHHPVAPTEQEIIIKKNRQLIATQESISQERNIDPFSFYNIHIRTKSDLVVAKYLFDALISAKQDNFERAKSLVDAARALSPEYYEVHRIDAIIKTQEGNLSAAQLAYDTVMDLEPSSVPVRKWYGDFKMKYLGDTEAALGEYEVAEKIDPKSGEIKFALARANIYLGRYEISQKILSELIETKAGSNRFLRRVFDLSIQCYCRWAEKISESDADGAFEKLEMVCKIYESCPRDLIDFTIIERLKKARGIAQVLMSSKYAKNIREKLVTLSSWLGHECNTYMDFQAARSQGTIHSLFLVHGFIKIKNGDTIFFHKSDLEIDDWKSLWAGDDVTFIIGPNPRDEHNRLRAFNVRLKTPKAID